MSLTYAEMLSIFAEIQPLISGATVSHCSEIDSRHYVFNLTKDSNKYSFLVCLQEPFLRFHLMKFNSEGAVKESFVHRLNEAISGSILHSIELLNEDRILMLTFLRPNSKVHFVAELFPKSSNAYLLDSKMHILSSLRNHSEEMYVCPEKHHITPKPIAESISSALIENLYFEKEKQARFVQEKVSLQREINNRLNRSQRLKSNSEKELAVCLGWKEMQHEGLLLQSKLYLLKQGMTEISIPDWENDNQLRLIKLEPSITPAEEITLRFKKSKKLRAGVSHTKEMLKKAEKEILHYSDLANLLDSITELDKLLLFEKKTGIKKHVQKSPDVIFEEKSLPYREFYSASGLKIWVGKSAKNNEDLTFRYAHGTDWWLHVRDFPGSHVIIKVKKQQEPDSEAILDAVQLALLYSKAKNHGSGDVCLTQCKYVTRFGKGQVGKVQISKHKIIQARFDPERLNRIKSRKPV